MPVPGAVFQPRSLDPTGQDDTQGERGGENGGRGGEAQTAAGKAERECGATDNASVNGDRGNKGRGDKSAGDRATTTPPEYIEGMAGDVLGYQPTPEDQRLREVYGDWVHANSGTHLDGGVRNDSTWQAWWRDLAVMPSRRYDAPSGKVGQSFVGTLREDMKGVRDRRWNSERFIVFQTMILQRACHVTASQAIRRRIGKRLDAWGEGKHAMQVKDTMWSCK